MDFIAVLIVCVALTLVGIIVVCILLYMDITDLENREQKNFLGYNIHQALSRVHHVKSFI